jgi:hypothetical protein
MGSRHDGKVSETFTVKHEPNAVIGTLTKNLVLGADESALLWATSREVRARSDELVFFVRTATVNPRIRVTAPPDLATTVVIASRDVKPEGAVGTGAYSHEGVLLPYQAVRVRWWPRDAT